MDTAFINCTEDGLSTGILANLGGAKSIELVDTYQRDANKPDSIAREYRITGANGYEYYVLSTNGDPIWEEQDPAVYAEAKEWYMGGDAE